MLITISDHRVKQNQGWASEIPLHFKCPVWTVQNLNFRLTSDFSQFLFYIFSNFLWRWWFCFHDFSPNLYVLFFCFLYLLNFVIVTSWYDSGSSSALLIKDLCLCEIQRKLCHAMTLLTETTIHGSCPSIFCPVDTAWVNLSKLLLNT